ncbi:alpha/beta fold hydrolase [Micromonospora sp. NPDC006766]|uniref:thioesterase II family protein n=1 Tax=Micromonospora sp. NPDC006766 TaxID=3154778 RepID=UPI00340977BB
MMLSDAAIVRPIDRAHAARTLVCLGFAGGGTGAYRPWADVLDSDTDLAIVCYPGREGRYTEPAPRTWPELVTDATEAVVHATPTPFVLFGHSMGGWVAFDVALQLERRGGPIPDALVVSSCNSPVRGLTDKDRFPRAEDGDEELIEWMRTSGSLPDYILDDADMRAMAIRLMRADLQVRDTYDPERGARVGVPMQVFYGADDAVIEPTVADQWRTAAAGDFRVTCLPGGHFYTPRLWRRLPTRFAAWTAASVR